MVTNLFLIMPKKTIKWVLALIGAFVLFALFDLYAYRGYVISHLISSPTTNNQEVAVANVTYSMTMQGQDDIHISIKNNSILPFVFQTYRNDEIFFRLEDEQIIQHGLRYILVYPKNRSDASYGFDCGTGLGWATINPYEAFEATINYDDILAGFSIVNTPSVIVEDTILDPFHWQPLAYLNEERDWVFTDNLSRFEKDTIVLKYFLPVHSLLNGQQMNAYSNLVKIPYLDIIDFNIRRFQQETI